MTKYRVYHLALTGIDEDQTNLLDAVRQAVQALPDFQPGSNGVAVVDGLARAREVAQAIRTIFPGIAATVVSVDVRDDGT